MKTKNIIGWVLTVLLAAALFFSASMKLTGTPQGLKMAAFFGLSAKKFIFLGIVEVVSTILFLVPRTGLLGLLLLTGYLGGAIATHFEHFQQPTAPVVLECILWIAASLRFPELSARLMNKVASV